ncbi:hypothetical protein Bca4012_061298 [Brassica carinata]
MVRDDAKCELCSMLKITQHEVRYGTVIRFSAYLKGTVKEGAGGRCGCFYIQSFLLS